MTSTWRASGPNRTARERSVLSTPSRCLLSSSKLTSVGGSTPDKGPRLPNISIGFLSSRSADSRVLSLVYEEFCLCEERDGSADVDSFCDRYPDWKSSLESQLRYHRLISQAAGANRRAAAVSEGGRELRGIPAAIASGQGGNIAGLSGQRPFARGQTRRLEGHARPRSRAEDSRAARSSSHRPGQFGDLSGRGAAVRSVHALSAGAAA